MRQVLLGAAFLAGIAAGLYLGAVVREGHAQSAEVAAAIHDAAVRHGVSEPWLRRILWCESRFTPWVTSRGGHMGIAQFSRRTWDWMSARAGWRGASPYEPTAAIDVLAWGLRNGYAGHWSCA